MDGKERRGRKGVEAKGEREIRFALQVLAGLCLYSLCPDWLKKKIPEKVGLIYDNEALVCC